MTDLTFECIKVSMRQDKDGVLLTLRIHPNDVPQELHQAWVGTRYGAALVEITDEPDEATQKEIDKRKEREADYQKALKLFAVAAASPEVRAYLIRLATDADDHEYDHCRHDNTDSGVHDALLRHLSYTLNAKIESRTDLKRWAASAVGDLSNLIDQARYS